MKLKPDKHKALDDIPEFTRKLQKWEYKVATIESDLENHLDQLGAMGWELVTIESRARGEAGQKYLWTVFKRPVLE